MLGTLHGLGAPEDILVSGKPHLGTDRLVRILRAFREHLVRLGVEIRFGARVEDLLLEGGKARPSRQRHFPCPAANELPRAPLGRQCASSRCEGTFFLCHFLMNLGSRGGPCRRVRDPSIQGGAWRRAFSQGPLPPPR